MERKCKGWKKKAEPCEFINECDVCVGFSVDSSENEIYIIGRGDVLRCKRDNPYFGRKFTEEEIRKDWIKCDAAQGFENAVEILREQGYIANETD